jgi:hypothetical protein
MFIYFYFYNFIYNLQFIKYFPFASSLSSSSRCIFYVFSALMLYLLCLCLCLCSSSSALLFVICSACALCSSSLLLLFVICFCLCSSLLCSLYDLPRYMICPAI